MSRPENMMMVGNVVILDGVLDLKSLEHVVLTHLLPKNVRFQQRIHSGRLPIQYWENDPLFDVKNHLHRVALPRPGDEDALRSVVSDLMSTALDLTRSPWDIHLIDGYLGQHQIMFTRIHHCMGDGAALMKALLDLTDHPRVVRHGTRHRVAARTIARGAQIPLAPLDAGRSLWTLMKLLALFPDATTPLRGPLHRRKSVAWTQEFALDDVHAAATALKCTINDLTLTAITGALRSYLHAHGSSPPKIRAMVPVDIRDSPSAQLTHNYFGLVFLDLPLHTADRSERLRVIRDKMRKAKDSPEPAVTFQVLELLALMPSIVQRPLSLFFGSKGTMVITNVRGPEEPLSVGGAPMSSSVFFAPESAQLGIGISIFSYNTKMRIGIIGDSNLLTQPGSLGRSIEAEMTKLVERSRTRRKPEIRVGRHPIPAKRRALARNR